MNNIDFTNFLNSMLTSITTAQVLTVLASVVGIGMTFFLMWFGVRLITNRFTKAVEGGNILKTELSNDRMIKIYRPDGAVELRGDKTIKTIRNSDFAPKPIEPVEPSGKTMTKKERKEFDDWYATHDNFGHELGYDKRQWNNNINKKNNYKKKYNNYKKNYYYDSHGNKYYK